MLEAFQEKNYNVNNVILLNTFIIRFKIWLKNRFEFFKI